MKHVALLAAGLVAVPLVGGSIALGQGDPAPNTGTTTAPNTNRVVNIQAGSTRPVKLSRISGGTGYSWKWVTRPASAFAKEGAPRAQKAKPGAAPGSKVWWQVGVMGLAEDQTTSGVVGLYGPGATSPERTITLKITVTGDGR
jgi:hypothetical protein